MSRKIFIELNHSLTSSAPEAIEDRFVYVDLMHNNIDYLLRSMHLGRAVGLITGCRLIGISGNPGVVAQSAPLDPGQVDVELAASFGITEIISVPQHISGHPDAAATRSALESSIAHVQDERRLSSDEIRALQQVVTSDGVHVGRFAQDTMMRSNLQPTLTAGAALKAAFDQVSQLDVWFKSLFDTSPPAAFVTGHIDYAPWGLCVERAVIAGGVGVYFRCDVRVPIHLFFRPTPATTLNGQLRLAEIQAFTEFLASSAGGLDELADTRHRIAYSVARNWRWAEAVDSCDADASWPFSSGLPCVVLFTHTFTDQPSSDISVFVDHLHWLECTLEHAARLGTYDLLIKIHPLDPFFDITSAMDRLEALYSCYANIAFVRQQIPHSVITERCVLGITVRGTPGLEMVAAGLPMLLAGRAQYDGLGFSEITDDEPGYFDAIERFISAPRAQVRASLARQYAAYDRLWSAPASPILGAFDPRRNVDAVWALAVNAARSTALESDEITLALSEAWNKRVAPCRKVTSPLLRATTDLWSNVQTR